MEKIPHLISSYLHHNFEEASVSDIKKIPLKDGVHYEVEVKTDDQVYHLSFNPKGQLVGEWREPIFSDDYSYYDFLTDD